MRRNSGFVSNLYDYDVTDCNGSLCNLILLMLVIYKSSCTRSDPMNTIHMASNHARDWILERLEGAAHGIELRIEQSL